MNSSLHLVHDTAAVLREAILSGQLPAGVRLVQDDLARELRTSRTPVREALRLLEQQGLVTAQSGRRGTIVSFFSPDVLLESFEVRELLDGLAARRAATRMTESELATLREIQTRGRTFLEPWDPIGRAETDAAFHSHILVCARSRALERAMALGGSVPPRLPGVMYYNPEGALQAIEEHEAILAALAAHDEVAVEQAARSHVSRVIERLGAGMDGSERTVSGLRRLHRSGPTPKARGHAASE